MILLKADIGNPAHFFGACGVFELVNMRKPRVSRIPCATRIEIKSAAEIY